MRRSSAAIQTAAKLGTLLIALVGVAGGSVASGAIINLPDVTITSLEHSHNFDEFFGSSTSDGVTIPSGRGTYNTAPTSFSGHVRNGDTVTEQILAPAGQTFSVHWNPNLSFEALFLGIYWQDSGSDASSTGVTPVVTFDNLIGIAPTSPFASASVGNGGNVLRYDYQANVVGDFSFTGVTISFPVNNSPTAVDQTFNIGSNSDPSFHVFGSSSANIDGTLLSLAPVPEPSTFVLAGLGLVGLALVTHRRRHCR